MSAWTIRIEAETDASAERALRQALKSLPIAEDDSTPYRLEINSEDVSDGPFEGEAINYRKCNFCYGSGWGQSADIGVLPKCGMCGGTGMVPCERPAGGE